MASMRTIGVRLRLLVDDYKREARDASNATDELSGKINKAGQKSQADLDKISLAAAGAGAALLAAAGVAVFAAAKFDKQMSEVRAVTGAAADEQERLRQAALDAGAATVFSATEAAQAEAELAKAGIATADILGGALTGSLSLASAGSLDLAQAAEIASASMNTFGLEGKDVGHIADVLAAASNKSAASVQSLGLGLAQVGLVAAQNNLTLEETVGVLSALADRGLQGSDAGTSLKTALQRLAAPTSEADKLMKSLGVSMYDANGNIVDVATVAGQLQRGLEDLAPAQRNAALQAIFGSDAIRAGNVLYAEGEAGIRDYIAAVNDQGAAARVAQTKLDNLAGDVEALTGSLETLAIGAGGGANEGLRVLTQTATGLVNAFGALPSPVQSALVILSGATGAALLAAAGWIRLRGTIADVTTEMRKTGPAGRRVAGALETTAKWAGRAGVAIGGLSIAGNLAAATFGNRLNPQIAALSAGMEEWAESGKVGGEVARLLGDDADKLNLALVNATSGGRGFATWVEGMTGLGEAFDASWTKNIERIEALDTALAGVVQSGNADQAAKQFALIEQRAKDLGISTDELRRIFPQYFGALEVAGKETKDLAKDTANLAREQLGATEAGQKLVEVWDALNGAMKSADEEMLDAVEATEAVTEAFKENKGALEGNTAAALKNRITLEDAARQAYEAADAYLANGGSAAGAAEILERFKNENAAAAIAAGGNAEQVRALNDQLYRMPPQRRTTVVIDYKIGARPQGISGLAAFSVLRWGGAFEHADVGLLREAQVFAPRSPARYAFAEPATMGEAFVPKSGDRQRSLGILSQAAGWHGADVVPRDRGWYGGGGTGRIELILSAKPGAGDGVMREVVRNLQVEIGAAGGDVQTYLGRR